MKEYKVGEKFKFQDMPLVVVEIKKPTCTGCFFEGKIVETLRLLPTLIGLKMRKL